MNKEIQVGEDITHKYKDHQNIVFVDSEDGFLENGEPYKVHFQIFQNEELFNLYLENTYNVIHKIVLVTEPHTIDMIHYDVGNIKTLIGELFIITDDNGDSDKASNLLGDGEFMIDGFEIFEQVSECLNIRQLFSEFDNIEITNIPVGLYDKVRGFITSETVKEDLEQFSTVVEVFEGYGALKRLVDFVSTDKMYIHKIKKNNFATYKLYYFKLPKDLQ